MSQYRPWIAGDATGRVLEIGAGTGANLAHYRAAGEVVATEPDPYMLERARKKSGRAAVPVEFYQYRAEELPFPDSSFDTVVSSLVLCTVEDPVRALAEVRRVLKPGGTLRFMEHVRAGGEMPARVQAMLNPLWTRLGAGCNLDRPTAGAIRAAGFEIEEMQEEQGFPLLPVIAGVARAR